MHLYKIVFLEGHYFLDIQYYDSRKVEIGELSESSSGDKDGYSRQKLYFIIIRPIALNARALSLNGLGRQKRCKLLVE